MWFLFAVRLPKRNHFILRLSLSILSCFVLTFLVINANYLVAVARAIDVTSVSASFVITIVLLVLGSASQIAAVSVKK